MSVTPENMGALLSNPSTAGYLGAAMGLLQSSGASRLPVTMGAALGNSLAQSQGYQQQSQAILQAKLNNAMARLMLGYKGSVLDMLNGTAEPPDNQSQSGLSSQPPQSGTDTGTTPVTQSGVNSSVSQVLPTGTDSSNLLLSNLNPTDQGAPPQSPQAAPMQSGSQPQSFAQQLQAQLSGLPPAEQLAARMAIFQDPGKALSGLAAIDPQIQGRLARARSVMTLMNLREGGGVYDPVIGKMVQYNPSLPQGAVLTPQGTVQVAPGYPLTSTQLAMMSNLAKNATTAGQPAVSPTGVQTARTVGGALGEPTTPQGIANQVMGSGGPQISMQPRIPIAPVFNRAPSATQPQAPTVGPGGVPLPSGMGTIAPGSPVSLGAPITAALTSAYKSSTDSLQSVIAGGAEQQVALGSLAEMNTSLNNLSTGPGADYRVQLEKVADGLGGVFGVKAPPFKDITNSQVLAKTTTQFAESIVGSNNQNAVGALESISHMVPKLTNTVAANQINAATLTATAAYKNAESHWGQSWSKVYNGIGMDQKNGRWDGVWQQKAPYMAFLMNELPPPALQEMAHYAAHNATLRAQMLQAQKAAPWLRQNGYLPSP